MADSVLDSVSATGTSVMGNAPGVALSMFYQAAGHAYALTMQNAASSQQNVNSLNPALIANALKLINAPSSPSK